MRFLGLGLAAGCEHDLDVSRGTEACHAGGQPAIEVLFGAYEAARTRAGFLAMGGQIVDAAIIAAPKQCNTDAEKRDIGRRYCLNVGLVSVRDDDHAAASLRRHEAGHRTARPAIQGLRRGASPNAGGPSVSRPCSARTSAIETACSATGTRSSSASSTPSRHRSPPGKIVHVILDNYAAHKQLKVIAWRARTDSRSCEMTDGGTSFPTFSGEPKWLRFSLMWVATTATAR